MKTVCLFGSPKNNGSSTTLANFFLDIIGGDIQRFYLNKMRIRGCQACMACKEKTEKCVLKDDMAQVLDSVRETDLLIIASPIYFSNVTANVRMFIERTFSYFVPDHESAKNPSRLDPGKKLLYIITQGQPDERFYCGLFGEYELFFKIHGFTDRRIIRACGVMSPEDITDAMKHEIEVVARKILSA